AAARESARSCRKPDRHGRRARRPVPAAQRPRPRRRRWRRLRSPGRRCRACPLAEVTPPLPPHRGALGAFTQSPRGVSATLLLLPVEGALHRLLPEVVGTLAIGGVHLRLPALVLGPIFAKVLDLAPEPGGEPGRV